MTMVWSPDYLGSPGKMVLAKDYIHGPADPDVAAYIAAVETADGQGLEEEVKVAYSDFILGCKADGIWDAIKASCILAGARTTNGALVPLKGTAPISFNFDLVGDTDYDRKTGLVGNGSTKYLDSNRANNADPLNSKHLAVYNSVGLANNNEAWIGSVGRSPSVSATQLISFSTFSTLGGACNSSFLLNVAIGTGLGFIGLERNNSASQSVRFASATTTSQGSSASYSNTYNTTIFARNDQGSISNYLSTRLAFYSIGEALDLALLDARVSTLISDLGAAI